MARRRFLFAGAFLVAAVCCGIAAAGLPVAPLSTLGPLRSPGPPGPLGPEGIPVPKAITLAPSGPIRLGQSIGGVRCESAEQVLFHIHAHLTIFVRGKPRRVPLGIGIGRPHRVAQTPVGPFVQAGSCFAWLHTHAADGIVHVESPVRRVFTLGNFFDVWGQPLTRSQVGPARGRVIAIYNNKVYTGDPRTILLLPHAQIQLEVGRPLVRPQHISDWNGL